MKCLNYMALTCKRLHKSLMIGSGIIYNCAKRTCHMILPLDPPDCNLTNHLVIYTDGLYWVEMM
jgi:hypothetical protein